MNTEPNTLTLLKRLSAPYAQGYAHVQGPGGNTSAKADGKLMIKASGFTFNDLASGTGYAVLKVEDVFSNGILSNNKPGEMVVHSEPPGSRPSMEFQFHAMLGNFVLHTHSVYANVVLCAVNSHELLQTFFSETDFLLLPYVTPGLPIAEQLLDEMKKGALPKIIFLKNHGIIVHHDNLDEGLRLYNYVEHQLKKRLSLPDATNELHRMQRGEDVGISVTPEDFQFLKDRQLTEAVLIPDQTVFFKDKTGYSKEENKPVTIHAENRTVTISGTPRFVNAGIAMLQAVLYIRRQIKRLEMIPQFLTPADIADIHGLESEKHRISALN